MTGTTPDHAVQAQIEDLQKRFPITVRAEIVQESGFTGSEVAVLSVCFLITEITSGFLQAFGAEMWERIKALCTRLRKSKLANSRAGMRLIVRAELPGGRVRFVCRLDGSEGIGKLDLFAESLTAEVGRAESSPGGRSRLTARPADVELELTASGTWRANKNNGGPTTHK